MKQLLDFLPLIVFFAVYKFYDIYAASGALIIASIVQIIALKAIFKHVEKAQWIGFIFICVFGGLTYFLQNDAFIKWKVTIINLLFAAILVGGQLTKKPIMKQLLGKEMHVSDDVWSTVSWLWIGFFCLCAGSNWYIASYLSQETWVNFKVFGLMGMTLVMTVITVVYLFKHLPEHEKKALKK
jgi:intracellular septation protein